MSTAFEQVTVDPACLAQRCEKQGCAVGLQDVPCPFRLIDMDHPQSPATGGRCDYLFVGDGDGDEDVDLYVVPLELKSSGIKAATVASQLSRGAKVAEKVTPNVHCRFVPVVAYGRVHRAAFADLAKRRVMFRRKHYAIEAMPCDGSLSEVL